MHRSFHRGPRQGLESLGLNILLQGKPCMAFKKSKPNARTFCNEKLFARISYLFLKKIHLTRPNLHLHESSSFIHDHTVIKNQKKTYSLFNMLLKVNMYNLRKIKSWSLKLLEIKLCLNTKTNGTSANNVDPDQLLHCINMK